MISLKAVRINSTKCKTQEINAIYGRSVIRVFYDLRLQYADITLKDNGLFFVITTILSLIVL